VALFVGKFIPKKRPLDLLRALSTLNSQPSTINYSAVFVGSGELGCQLRDASHVVFDAEANSSLSASIPLAHPMGEGSRVRASESGERAGVRCSSQPSTINPQLSPPARPRAAFAGFKNQSELPACYAAADVLILPSDGGETWGLVVNEAMACGLPAIVSDAVGCAPDLINEGKTGFTFPLGDVAALTEKLAAFARMKRAGHDFAPALAEKMRRYSVEAAVRGTVEAVKKLKAESRK
jgi:glycosyltransferase involved in cell wall biosynthesis